jgi:hypothetical protein
MDTRITRLRAPKNIDWYEGLLETKLTELALRDIFTATHRRSLTGA